ncbi:MAG: acetate--CoA ligase family protein [Desulfobacterales bacterium]|nr:acetate--CoA ligase family protein [Desulfobacterales bacterium]MBF0396413.1 acetate--CoA ligase family protein [Desulfobacterales bacterium]
MKTFFEPETVAVIGVSARNDNLSRAIVRNLIEFDFKGIIYLVGPKGGVQFGRRIYRSVVDIPDRIDLAIILTPASTLPELMEQLGEKGVKHAVVESAGFREYGKEGKAIEEEMVNVAKRYGIRFIGPNCIGVINNHNGLCVPFTPFKNVYKKGGVTVISQSGGVGMSYLNALASEAIGLRCFAAIGNKIDVDENDLIEYFLSDDLTEIIVLYLEGISDGKRLMKLAMTAKKPILVHKSNTGKLGSHIAASHTASLSSDDAVVDAALRQCGIARFYKPEQLVNYLKSLPLPRIKGNKLVVISRSGGHAVISTDECERHGFTLAQLPEPFFREIEKHFRAKVIALQNPLDLGDLFDMDVYKKIIERTLREDTVDGVVFLHTFVSQTEGAKSRELIEQVADISMKVGKPLTICVETENSESASLKRDVSHPIFTVVEDAINSLALSRDFGMGYIEPAQPPELDVDFKIAQDIISICEKENRDPMLDEAMAIFKAYGLPTLPAKIAKTEDEAAFLAKELGYPVVMKVVAPQVSHKTDLGGVQLNLKTEEGVRNAWKEICNSISCACPSAQIEGIMIQPMAKTGPELILGGKEDRNFGPCILVGVGGIFVEIFKQASTRIAPFSKNAAFDMINSLSVAPILNGARGQKPYDVDSLVDSLLRICRLKLDFPQIAEFDANPVRVRPKGEGCVVLDARIILTR